MITSGLDDFSEKPEVAKMKGEAQLNSHVGSEKRDASPDACSRDSKCQLKELMRDHPSQKGIAQAIINGVPRVHTTSPMLIMEPGPEFVP